MHNPQELIQSKKKDNGSIIIPIIVTFVAANFLFFIDEGYYDFRWMLKFGNWVIFLIYAGFLFGGQLLVKYTVFRKAKSYSILSCFLGLIVGTGIALLLFSGAWR